MITVNNPLSSSGLSGTLTASDVDGDTLSYNISGGSADGGNIIIMAGTYGSLNLNTSTGDYLYSPDTTALESLDSGATDSDIFSVSASDGTDSDSGTLTIDINNNLNPDQEDPETSDETPPTTDSPEQSPGLSLSAITPGSISELKHDTALSSSNLSGKLSSSIDQTDSITYAISGGRISEDGTTSLIGKCGTLTLNTKSGNFAYEPHRINIEALSAKQTEPDVFILQATDSQGNTVSEIFTVEVTGADELKLIGVDSSDQRSARTQHHLPIITSQKLGAATPHFEAPEGVSTEQGLPVDFSNLVKPVNQLITTAISGIGMIKDAFSSNIELNLTGVYFNSGAGDDLITGTDFNDFIRCGAGDDDLDAGSGDDIVRLGSGDDNITLGAGDDIIYLTADQLQGKSSNRIADFNSIGNDQIIIDQRLEDYITIQGLGTASIKLTLTGPEDFVGMGGITTLISDAGVIQANNISFA